MVEPTIQEVVEVQGSYTAYVDLRLKLFNDNDNSELMSRYRPIASHRQAFSKLTKSLNVKDKRCYLLTGSYGTGKSHLCLMLANYFRTPASEQPMPKFFENYAVASFQEADELRARRQKGRYLIALCDWGGKGDFDELVLRAVDEALKREEIAEDLDTPYLQALRKINAWKQLADAGNTKGTFYADFERMLVEREPGQTLAFFTKRLALFENDALEMFKRIHLEVTTAPFTYDKADLLAILTSTLASTSFKDRFLGILVLFDEFGDTMEQNNMNPKTFQQFAQLCADTPSNSARLIFVGTAHKDLTAYARTYNTTDLRTASDRIESILLTPDGVEDIIAAIVAPKKESTLWSQQVLPHATIFERLLADCKRLKLFDWLKTPKIREAIIENIYPMHPMATFALLQLARDVASNNRSVFTFFSGEVSPDADIGSYGHYIAITPILNGNKLNLYTADRLFDYFLANLRADNRELRDTLREYIKDFESSVRELKRTANQDMSTQLEFQEDLLIQRILQLMLIYQIIGIPNTQENLQFGLYCNMQDERSELENRLHALVSKGILYFIRDSKIYEFKQNTGIDLDQLIENYIHEPKNMPVSLVAELNILAPLDRKDNNLFIDAKDYNLSCGEDKRLERRFVRVVDLGEEENTPEGKKTYFDKLEAEIETEIARKGEFEGIALHVVCETVEDIQRARDYCTRNESAQIVVALSKQPVPLLDIVLELRALLAIKESQEEKNFTVQDKAALNSRLNGGGNHPGAQNVLRTRRDRLLSNKELNWFGQYGQALSTDESNTYDVANRVMEQVYVVHHNTFIHEDFNKLHIKIDRTRSVALKEAVEKLLDYQVPLTVDTSFAQARGDIRYLQKCLLNQGVLRQVRTEGSKLYCELETNPQKYEVRLPTLAIMVREVQNLQSDDKIRLVDWVKKYRQPPYGQGIISLALSLACLCRLFGDSIRFKQDEMAIGDLPVRSFEIVHGLLEGNHPNAFFRYRQLRVEEKELVNNIYVLFGQPDSAVIRDYTVVEAHTAIKDWWKNLPPLSGVTTFYQKSIYPYTVDLIHAFKKIETKDAHSFLFGELPAVFGSDVDVFITRDMVETLQIQLSQQKNLLESAVRLAEERIIDEVHILFEAKYSTYPDIMEAISTWYNTLDSNQKDPHARWQDKDSKPLILHLRSIDSLQEILLTRIPVDYGLKAVPHWIANRVAEYTDKLKKGKAHIDANRLKVEMATITFIGDYERENHGPIYFKDRITVTFQHTDPHTIIYVAEGGFDPRDASTARQQVNCAEPLIIQDNKTIKVASQDANGNWSQQETIQLMNLYKKHEIHLPLQKSLLVQDEAVTFAFPTSVDSFTVTCRSLFALGLERHILTIDQLMERLQILLNELKREQ